MKWDMKHPNICEPQFAIFFQSIISNIVNFPIMLVEWGDVDGPLGL